MTTGLKIQVPTLFCLAFDIEKAANKSSGFQPARFDLGAAKALFGDLRLEGFAAAIKTGFAKKLVIAGGDEVRYKGETPIINRAWAIGQMLVHDYGIDAGKIETFASKSNTLGNVGIFKDYLKNHLHYSEGFALMTNLYHGPRAEMDMTANLIPMQFIAAEAMILVENPDMKNELVHRLGDGPLAERYVEELAGIADKIRGTYQSRTDVAPVSIPGTAKV
jgi:hypothetical protein